MCLHNSLDIEDIFVNWLKNFIEFSELNLNTRMLLNQGNHVNHVSLQSYEICSRNYIKMLLILPRSSHRLRSFAITFHSPLMSVIRHESDLFMKGDTKITPRYLAELFNNANAGYSQEFICRNHLKMGSIRNINFTNT